MSEVPQWYKTRLRTAHNILDDESFPSCDKPKGMDREEYLYKIIDEMFTDFAVTKHFKPRWLSPQHLDVGIHELSIAVEYQGKQHYEHVPYLNNDPEKQNENDKKKRQKCTNNDMLLIYFDYREDLSVELIQMKLKQRILDEINQERNEMICASRYFKRDTYHLETCKWALEISKDQLFYFQNQDEAEEEGYHPCNNCFD